MDQLIQNLPFDNDKPYIEHVKRTNTFSLKEDPDQTKKSEIWISAADGKIKRSLDDSEIRELKKKLKRRNWKIKKIRRNWTSSSIKWLKMEELKQTKKNIQIVN